MIACTEKDKINNIISSYQQTERTILEGSDQHLDLILDVRNDLARITNLTKDLVEDLEQDFNTMDKTKAKETVVNIFPCLRMAHQITSSLRRSFICNEVKQQVNDFDREVNELKEIVSDLSRYKVEKNDDLVALFNDETDE